MSKAIQTPKNLDFSSTNISNNSKISILNNTTFNNLNTLTQNIAPFNTSQERLFYSEEDTPGPGSYFNNNTYKSLFSPKKAETTKENILNKFDIYNFMLKKKINKIKELKKLKLDKNNKNQVIAYSNTDKRKQKKLNIKLLVLKDYTKENSIPYLNSDNFQELMLRPIELKTKEIILKPKSKIFQNKDKKVFQEIKLNNKEILSSNCSTNSSLNNNANKQKISPEENSKMLLSNNSFIQTTKIDFEDIKKNGFFHNSKIKNINFKFFPKMKSWQESKNDLANNLSYNNYLEGDPGPGYYNTNSSFDKYKFFKYQKKKFNFGSNQEREVIKPIKKDSKKKVLAKIILNVENNIKRNKKLFPKLSQSKITLRDSISSNDLIKKLFEFNQDKPSFEHNNSYTQYQKDKSLNLGPGQYNIKSQFDQTNKTKKYTFPTQKRFSEEKGKQSPGPGAYISLINWYQKDDDNNENIIQNNTNNEIITLLKNNLMPNVGTYNPHIVNSIEYKNLINNNINFSNIPFGSSEEKFIKKINSTPDFIGPGSYFNKISNFKTKNNIKGIKYKYKNEENNKKKENIKMLYKRCLQSLKDKIGPGSYINEKLIYSDWHKKTFNIMNI